MENNQKSNRILLFSTSYYPFVGGAEIAIKEITDRISDADFDLITAKMNKKLPFREKVGNVTVYRLGIGVPFIDKLILPFEGALFARHLLKKRKYNAFWCMMVTFASGAAYIYNLFSKIKIPIILTLQEGDSEKYLKTKWFGLLNLSWRLALSYATKVTAISSYLADRAKRLGYKKEVKIIPNGVDVGSFELKVLSLEERQKIREELRLKEGDVALITTSRLVVKNGVEDVIKALPRLNKNIKFIIFGDGDLKESLKLKAKSLEVEDRVIWKGTVSHDQLPKYLKACDIFIRPSLSEGMGNSFIEAMACRIPVIATPVGGIVDFLKDPVSKKYDGANVQTGYFCEPNNPESVIKTIERVLSDHNRDQVIDNAFNMVKEKYDWGLIAKHIREMFDRVITNEKH